MSVITDLIDENSSCNARIAELEDLVLSLQCKAIESDDLRAELAAIKAQEPTGWYTEDHLDDKSATTYSWAVAERWVEKGWPVSPLYALPVSEAKAHGNYAPASVVWIDAHHVIEGNNPSFIKDVALVSVERTSETQIPLVRLNAAPVQQVSVPDELAAFEREDRYIVIKRSDMDRIPNQKVVHSFLGALGELSAHSVRIPQRKFLVIESDWPEYDPAWKLIQDRVQGRPILDAAPAAPAADAGGGCAVAVHAGYRI